MPELMKPNKIQIPAWLHTYTGPDPAIEYYDFIAIEKSAGDWSAKPVTIAVPADWMLRPTKEGTEELCTEDGKSVKFARLAKHRKSVEVTIDGEPKWLSMRTE